MLHRLNYKAYIQECLSAHKTEENIVINSNIFHFEYHVTNNGKYVRAMRIRSPGRGLRRCSNTRVQFSL